MTQPAISGSLTLQGTGGDTRLPSARFLVQSGIQTFVTDTRPVVWDATLSDPDSFDDIGLGSDYSTTGVVEPPAGDYQINAYAQLQGDVPFTGGTARISILDAGAVTAKRTFPLAVGDQNPELGLSDLRRYFAINFGFTIEIALVGATGPAEVTIVEASVTITKTR